jgi:hypothetical protein
MHEKNVPFRYIDLRFPHLKLVELKGVRFAVQAGLSQRKQPLYKSVMRLEAVVVAPPVL